MTIQVTACPARPPRMHLRPPRGERRSTFRYYGLPVLALLLCLGSPGSRAHPKTDVVTLYNGDRITGEVRSLQGGILSLGTDSMGTLSIEWNQIATLNSAYNYELRLSSGERRFGSPGRGARPGTVSFVDIDGAREYEALQIIELRPIEERASDRLDVYLSANYSFTKASGVQQTEFNADIDYDDKNTVTSLDGRLTASITDAERSTSSRLSLARQSWTDRRNYYRQLSLGFESNDELGLDARYTVGAGIGRYILDTNRQRLSGGVGVQALQERSADGQRLESMEAVLAAEFARWRFDDPELDLVLNSSLYPSLTERGRLRGESSARLRWEIVDDLYWNLNAWGSYDNAAVDEQAGEFDWGVTTGFGWKY